MGVRMVKDYGYDVTIYCRSNYYDEKPRYYKGVRCVYLPAPGGKSFESIIHSNLSILHTIFCRYDVVLVLDPGNAPFVLPLKLRRLPVLIHTDGMGWKRQKWSPLQQKYYKWSEKVSALLANWLVTDSKAMQQYYIDEYTAPSTFIPYAGEISPSSDDSILEEYKLTKNGYYLCVARIEPDNNIDVIIREYRRANVDKPLVVVGSARYNTPYGKAIADEDDEKVHCIGGVYEKDKLNALFANSYLYLHGHEVGGTNPSLLNAMHMRAAPVAMDVVFHREVMTDDGLFFTKEENHLASIIQELDQDAEQVEKLKSLARLQSDSLYRWDAVVDAYVKLAKIIKDTYRDKASLKAALKNDIYTPLDFFNKNNSE
jgi:glycosyltransferase involved in cell wall biosynthesis